jgi:hypothetical protein
MITWRHAMATTHAGGLIAELSRRATQEGGNTTWSRSWTSFR